MTPELVPARGPTDRRATVPTVGSGKTPQAVAVMQTGVQGNTSTREYGAACRLLVTSGDQPPKAPSA